MSPGRGAEPFDLPSLPTRAIGAVFSRCVPQLDFDSGRPPRYFFASGRPGRLNPAGVRCIYVSDGDPVADAEYAAGFGPSLAVLQPKLTFRVRATIANVLDLETPGVLDTLKLRDEDLFGGWILATHPTRLQRLGAAIASQARIAGVRYPSAAARALSPPGWNLVVYLDVLREPDHLEVIGKPGEALEVYP